MLAGVSEEQRAVLLQVLNMTPDRINALPDGERAAIQQLVRTLTQPAVPSRLPFFLL